MRTLLLVDGMNLLFRGYHALSRTNMSTRDGVPTFAVYGFAASLLKAAQDTEPDGVVVAWDSPGDTFRHEQYRDYKAQREAAPDDFHVQVPLAHRLLEALNVQQVAMPGYEADDLIGSLALAAERRGAEVLILSGDRDMLQLVRPGVTVLYPGRGGDGVLDWLDEGGVVKKLGVRPDQVADLKGLMGDSSDNIKGVPGIGEKSAVLLLSRYDHLEDVFKAAAAGEIPESRIRRALIGQEETAYASRRLATIQTDLAVDVPDATGEPYRVAPSQELREVLEALQFRSLARRLLGEEAAGGGPDREAAPPAPELRFDRIVPWPAEGPVALEPMPPGAEVLGYRVATAAEAGVVAELPNAAPGQDLVGFDVKPWVETVPQALRPQLLDAALAAYLLDPTRDRYGFEDLAALLDRPVENLRDLAACVPAMKTALEERGLWALYRDVEMPLVQVLAAMEARGMVLDKDALTELGQELDAGLAMLQREIFEAAGMEFNLNSSRQLATVLYDKLGLPRGRKTKTGYSTDADTLEALAAQHPVVEKVLAWRQLEKLRGTYVEGLLPLVGADGRVHTHLNQMVAATGRLSSSDPNLQNIPVRSAWGQRVRSVFRPSPGRVLLAADYSQIELRMLAHFADDPVLLSAFRTGEDIHRRTAAEMFGVQWEAVGDELRSRAKAINFGIIYGISDFGLANQTGVSRAAAAEYIARYFERYPTIRAFFDRVLADARRDGYVATVLGRRRPLPDIAARHPVQRHYAERTAVNTVVQGSAADLIKVAMVRLEAAFADRGLRSGLVLQVHDELIWDAVPEEVPAVIDLAASLMTTALPLNVPLVVDFKQGPDWGHLQRLAASEGTRRDAGTA